MQGRTPDHSTIANFVGRHGRVLRKLFGDTLRVLIGANRVKLAHVAIDGSSPPKRIASITDPDARSMRYEEGHSRPNFNIQLAVHDACGVIVAARIHGRASVRAVACE